MVEILYNLSSRLVLLVANLGKFFLQPISVSNGLLSPLTSFGGVEFTFEFLASNQLFGAVFDILFRVIGVDPTNTTLLEMLPIIMALCGLPFIVLHLVGWIIDVVVPS